MADDTASKRFRELARKLVKVPKRELDEARAQKPRKRVKPTESG